MEKPPLSESYAEDKINHNRNCTPQCSHTVIWIALVVNTLIIILIGASSLLHIRQNEIEIHQLKTQQMQLTAAFKVIKKYYLISPAISTLWAVRTHLNLILVHL